MPAESSRGNTLNVSAIILLIMVSLTDTHSETHMQLEADSDTKEVEVTLSVSEAINLCHLKPCVSVQVYEKGRKQLAGNSGVCVCSKSGLQEGEV